MTAASPAIEEEFAAFENGALEPANFPHREHVRLAYEMLSRFSFGDTATRFSRGLRHLARKSGWPQLYHETITLAFLAVIGERMATTRHSCWEGFAAANGDLLDKHVLRRWYSADQLQSNLARKTFCLPSPRTIIENPLRR
ncbi:MAG: hypothetical protein M3505_05225 [Verrucomicrobiota bacterium]|nr:hypothetical protein [Verrucomicrobiota bacterium]